MDSATRFPPVVPKIETPPKNSLPVSWSLRNKPTQNRADQKLAAFQAASDRIRKALNASGMGDDEIKEALLAAADLRALVEDMLRSEPPLPVDLIAMLAGCVEQYVVSGQAAAAPSGRADRCRQT